MSVLSRRYALLFLLCAGIALPPGPLSNTPALADDDGHDGGDHDGGGGSGSGSGNDNGGDHADGGGGEEGHDNDGGIGGMGDIEEDEEDDDHERAYEDRRRGKVRPLSAILVMIRNRYGGRILDVKLRRAGERRYYVIRILDRRGRVRNVKVSAEKEKRFNFRARHKLNH